MSVAERVGFLKMPGQSQEFTEDESPGGRSGHAVSEKLRQSRANDIKAAATGALHGLGQRIHEAGHHLIAQGKTKDLSVFRLGFQKEVLVAITSFEKAAEWADLSSALGRFSKVVTALPLQMDLADFDSDRIIYRRLAQCLNRALPAGVHLKVCEIYDQILKRQNEDAIIRNLGMFTIGIFPVLTYAASPVRAAFFKVMQSNLLPLGPRLAPALVEEKFEKYFGY